MKSGGVRKAMGYKMGSFTNSPVNGLLYVRGKIGAPRHDATPPLQRGRDVKHPNLGLRANDRPETSQAPSVWDTQRWSELREPPALSDRVKP